MGNTIASVIQNAGSPDWGQLSDIGASLGGAYRQRNISKILAGVPMKDGVPDFNAAYQALASGGYPDEAMKVARFAQNEAGGNEFGLVPQIVRGKDGKLHYFQTNKAGGMSEVQLPEGYEPTEPVRYLDTGPGGYVAAGTRTPGPIQGAQPVPHDITGEAAAQETGKIAGQNQAALPDAIARGEQTLEVIDQAIQHPGRARATGKSSTLDPRNYFAGTEGKSYEVGPYKQVKGSAFLTSIQQMRGFGALSNQEGDAATAAATALDLAQTEQDHYRALTTLQTITLRGMIRAYDKAGKEVPQALIDRWRKAEQASGLQGQVPFEQSEPNAIEPNAVEGTPAAAGVRADAGSVPGNINGPELEQIRQLRSQMDSMPDGARVPGANGQHAVKRGGKWYIEETGELLE